MDDYQLDRGKNRDTDEARRRLALELLDDRDWGSGDNPSGTSPISQHALRQIIGTVNQHLSQSQRWSLRLEDGSSGILSRPLQGLEQAVTVTPRGIKAFRAYLAGSWLGPSPPGDPGGGRPHSERPHEEQAIDLSSAAIAKPAGEAVDVEGANGSLRIVSSNWPPGWRVNCVNVCHQSLADDPLVVLTVRSVPSGYELSYEGEDLDLLVSHEAHFDLCMVVDNGGEHV